MAVILLSSLIVAQLFQYILRAHTGIFQHRQRADLYLSVMGCLTFWKSTEISRDGLMIPGCLLNGYTKVGTNEFT
jgi:hypothetical protein